MGVRGSLPVSRPQTVRYGSCTSCVQVVADNGTCLLLDGGSGIYEAGAQYMRAGRSEPLHVFITHAHWDHIQGLPFFIPAFIPGTRITFYGCNQGGLPFKELLGRQMSSPYFPVEAISWQADITYTTIGESQLEVGGITVRSTYAEHPGMTLGLRIEYGGHSMVYLPDNEPFARYDHDKVFDRGGTAGGLSAMEAVLLEDQKKKSFRLTVWQRCITERVKRTFRRLVVWILSQSLQRVSLNI